ncbi:DUF3515 family protein [Cryptosporangium aurantiacum]|uniref:DUF3515 domain-containing protein n=1 Tax=Cryptosporangium aurantiacum TaxID=134849 RepID=A0A1M7HRA3_9ACTN|nr:DUF3515 family protein [Cryptosporangium aurantiacum]SHM30950.1 Protein of unknown function [Cryptosporangium aurantiacum]
MAGEVTKSDRYRAAVTATLVAIPLAVVAGLGVFWWSGGFAEDAEPKPAASSAVTVDVSKAQPNTETICRALLANLPTTLAEHASRPVSPATASERTAAWGDPAIVLRCGIGPPATTAGSADQTVQIDGVTWLVTEGKEQSFLRAVGLSVAVDLRLPAPYNVGRPGTLLRPLAGPILKSVPPAR